VSESDFAEGATAARRDLVVEFRGLEGLFTPLAGHHEFLRSQLWQMTRPQLRSSSHSLPAAFIAMHVRRGDITRQGFTPEELERTHIFTPLSWFVSMARGVREVPGLRELPVVVFSDGSRSEVGPLLEIPGVSLRDREPAIADLWAMSRAALLFATGYSTFGMWASFLGRMPTLYAPGKMQQRVQGDNEAAVEREVPEGGDAWAMLASILPRP
jgi:hypothetical protein